MKFWTKTKGAVSIFLVIILVPMMTVSSLFVDAGKVRLAKGVAESAGDLTLNTALTDYDTVLKDLYGLMATAQDTSELFDKLEDYYGTCITSSGVSEEDAGTYVDQIMAQLGMLAEGEETADILNMQLLDFNVSKISDASLANATIMEKQIVDFMKYRAPINTGLGFLSSLQSFSTLSKQTELVDNRKTYYEAEQTVMEKIQSAWGYINAYNKSSIITNENYFSALAQKLNTDYKSQYQNTINVRVIKDLYDTQSYIDYYCSISKEELKEKNASGVESTVEGWKFLYTAVAGAPINNYTEYYPKEKGGYDKNNLPSKDDIKTLMTNFYSQIQSMDANKSEIISPPGDAYILQYLVQNMRKQSIQRYTSSTQNVYTTYQKLKNAMIWVDGYDLTEFIDDEGNTVTAQDIKDTKITVNGSNKKISEHFIDISSKYETAMNAAKQYASLFSGYSTQVKNGGKTNYNDVNQKVSDISVAVKTNITDLETAATNLGEASKLLKQVKTAVSDGGSLDNAKNAWKATASSSELKNTSMAKQDLAEIRELGTYLNVDEIQKMIGRLDNVAANLRNVISQIKNYKYDSKFIGDINSYSVVKEAVKAKVGDGNLKNVPISESSLNQKVTEYFNWTSGNINIGWINDSGTQIKLHGSGTDKLNFYSYMYTHFNSGEVSAETTVKTEDPSNGKDLYKNIKDKSSSAASGTASGTDSGSITTSNELSALANRPSLNAGSDAVTAAAEVKTGDSATKNTSASLSSMFSNLASAALDMGTDLRDKLYVSDYVLSMFSYDTIEKEFAVKNPGKELSLQTLTLQPINKDNNFSYGKEVEYIIYGGSNESNLKKAYGSIYGIRFGFNLIYAFMDSEIRDGAFAIATPISAATLGVIPVPLIQAVIIVGIACCESAIDLSDIRDGQKVPLFKTQETWHCSVNGMINEAKGIAGSLIKEGTNYIIDEGTRKLGEVLDMTDEELNKYIDTGAAELTGYIGDAYDTLITRHANMAIQKLTTLANNAIEEAALNPSIDMVNYVSNGLDSWLASEASGIDVSSDIGYIVKSEAVKIIKSQFIGPIIDAIQDAGSNISTEISNMGATLTDKISDMRSQIVDKVNNGCDKVKQYKSDMLAKLEDSMKNGAQSVKNTLNEQIDGIFGSSATTGSDNTGIASLLSFSYSDYLRLFLMIGLYTNEEGILLRTGDVIQANMIKKTGKSDYKLSDSAAYVEITATIQVKPTLLALPLFADVDGNPSTNTNWYTIKYKSIKGY